MSEFDSFRDDWILPEDYLQRFTKYKDSQARRAVTNIDQEDTHQVEKFVVQEQVCRGSQHQPTCLYDFTNSVRVVDMYVFRSEERKIVLDHIYPQLFELKRKRDTIMLSKDARSSFMP